MFNTIAVSLLGLALLFAGATVAQQKLLHAVQALPFGN
jgi:hypothetical protein